MEKQNKSEQAAYAEGYSKGLRTGIIGAVIGSVFAMVAYDIGSAVILGNDADASKGRQEMVDPTAQHKSPRFNPPT